LTEFELIVDSYEQRRERPLNYQEQKKYYSGKENKHTFKNQIISLPKAKDLVDIVVGEPGPKHDLTIFRKTKESQEFELKQKFQADKAYQGETEVKTPKKKSKNQSLSSEDKLANQELSSQRVFVEHLIRVIKIFRVAQERFRLNVKKYEQVVLTICGLVRFRIGAFIMM
jgi:hypothetical protein